MNEKIKTGTLLNVLSLEDSVHDFEIIQKQLISAGYNLNISRVEKESELASSLHNNKYDVILADFKLPGFDAFGALHLCNEICPDIPFICVSGSIGEETAIELIKQGADDYVLKDKLKRLPFSIKRALDEAKERETRRLAEEALAKEQYLMYALMNSVPDNIYFKDRESHFIRISNALAKMFGLNDPSEAEGKTDFDFFTEEHARQAYEDEQEIIRTGQPLSKEEKETWADRPDTWASTIKLPLRNKEGNIVGTYGISMDITKRKNDELLLQEKNQEIEVQNKKLQQTNEELQKAKERAEESDHLKTAFLHNISHEIRTPMNAIVGFSRFLNDPGLSPEKCQNFIDIIMQSSEQLLSIISNIVSIATIEAGQEKIIEKEIELSATLRFLHEQFLLKANKQTVCLSLKPCLPDHEVWIISDETKLVQVLTNLIGNALKFTQQGYVNFGCKVNDNELEFFVEDTGLGIPKEMHEEIFKRFRQVESCAHQFGGSGLGLSISKAYIELLGGKMWLNSELGKGSTFYFTIPYKKAQKDTLPEKQCNNQLKIEINEPKTLLVAEDDDSNFMLLEELLAGLNFNLIRVINGLEAVETCKSNKNIDLVLMDIKMPVMDGYEATKKIREFMPDLPIIFQTAYILEIDKNKAFACGCNHFISKPLKQELLISKIKEQLNITYLNKTKKVNY